MSNHVSQSPPTYDLSSIEYSKTLLDINRAPLFPYLAAHGYSVYNLSVFRFDGHAPMYKESFLTVPPEDIFLYYTLWSCAKREIFWHYTLFANRHKNKDTLYHMDFTYEKKLNEGKLFFNQGVLDSITKIPMDTNKAARFIYAHLYMPHYPYFFDENGQLLDDTAIYHHQFLYDVNKFVRYVNYTNKRIQALTDSLLINTHGQAIIIIQSDHGYPGFEATHLLDYFKNLTAMYFPDHQYNTLYDSLSNVNTFRILLNKYFDEK
ncbi:MAG: hypothetical protein JST39_14075, partial [Bacteroidetes bacterium]|nr:hypothetical protein [Bacteroidota bacterium]